MKKKNKLNLAKRLSVLIVGLAGSMTLIVYSFRWEALGLNVNAFGMDISKWFFAFLIVLFGIIFATLTKSGLLGEWKLD